MWYCSAKCREEHEASHSMECKLLGFEQQMWHITHTNDDTTTAIRRSFYFNSMRGNLHVRAAHHAVTCCSNGKQGLRKKNFHLRNALRHFLENIVNKGEDDPDLTVARKGVESWALFLMVLLGGDAQLLLDWLAYSASWNASSVTTTNNNNNEQEHNNTPIFPRSEQSKENSMHPLLALHGLFDGDTHQETYCVFVNLYLLACFRSLAEHRQTKNGFEIYKQECLTSPRLPHKLPLEACQGYVATFLWDARKYDYGEALSEEIHRVIRHIREHKLLGREFLDCLSNRNGNMPFSRDTAPFLLSGTAVLRPVRDFWPLYQECFHQAPGLELSEFLDDGDVLSNAKEKKE
jgi:hypothetical protein